MCACSETSRPRIASQISVFTCSTAFCTPLPKKRWASPSRSSIASREPVEAPEGTAARPIAPDSTSTSASTVGLPRESRISRATTSTMAVIALFSGLLVSAFYRSDRAEALAARRLPSAPRAGPPKVGLDHVAHAPEPAGVAAAELVGAAEASREPGLLRGDLGHREGALVAGGAAEGAAVSARNRALAPLLRIAATEDAARRRALVVEEVHRHGDGAAAVAHLQRVEDERELARAGARAGRRESPEVVARKVVGAEAEARDRLGHRRAADVVLQRAGVEGAEDEREGADLGRRELVRVIRDRSKERPARVIERARERVRAGRPGLGGGEEPRRAVCVVHVERGEDDVVLVDDVEPPAVLRSAAPPEVGEVGAERGGGRGREREAECNSGGGGEIPESFDHVDTVLK